MLQEVQKISKDNLINYLTNNGFTSDGDNKFTKVETATVGKMIMNGQEIMKTQEIKIELEYIGDTSIEGNKEIILGHQIKLVVNDKELEFIINDKKDLHDFLGLNVGELNNNSDKTKVMEDIK